MYSRLYSYYLITQKRFKEVVLLADKAEPQCLCYALFKLGLYEEVIKRPYPKYYILGKIAYISSLIILDKQTKAEQLLYSLFPRIHWTKYALILIKNIAPYSPDLVLSLYQRYPRLIKADLSFSLAFFIQYDNKKARDLLSYLDQEKYFPQRDLLKANLAHSKQECLDFINNFFKYYNLETISLKNPEKELNVLNIYSNANQKINDGPLVSILLTTYQSEKTISQTLYSLLQQSYQNIEIIVIDDASDDNTAQIVQNIGAQDQRIKYIALPENIGTFAAKNIGFQFAQGEFVTCQDSDDWAHPRKIELQIQPLLKNKNLICTTSQWLRLKDNGQIYARLIYPLLRLNPASPLFRKQLVIEKMGCWDWVRTGADSEFLARLKFIFGENAIFNIKKPLTLGAYRENSLMTAEDTGYTSVTGKYNRLNYWASWQQEHLNCQQKGEFPYVDLTPPPYQIITI